MHGIISDYWWFTVLYSLPFDSLLCTEITQRYDVKDIVVLINFRMDYIEIMI